MILVKRLLVKKTLEKEFQFENIFGSKKFWLKNILVQKEFAQKVDPKICLILDIGLSVQKKLLKNLVKKIVIFRKGSKYYWEQSWEHKAETHSILTLDYQLLRVLSKLQYCHNPNNNTISTLQLGWTRN